MIDPKLWFDVGNGRYTTIAIHNLVVGLLWFDVGNGRYTTKVTGLEMSSCGLM